MPIKSINKFLTLTYLLFMSVFTYGQDGVQWATRVVDVSSEFSEFEFSAGQVLLAPNVLPTGGVSPSAWRPYKPNKKEYIIVGFENPFVAKQILIGESNNPGAITGIIAYDEEGNGELIYEQEAGGVDVASRMLHVPINVTYRVAALRILLNGKAVDGFPEIDCIGITASDERVNAAIKISQNINPNLVVNRLNYKVNSEYREIKPLLTKDRKTLYFSRRGHPGNIGGVNDMEDIWYTDRVSDLHDWDEAVNIGTPLNNPDPNFISSFLEEEQEYIILGNEYQLDMTSMDYGISKSLRVNDSTWTYPKSLNIYNDLNVHESVNFWLTRDDEILVISEEGRRKEGERDLYVSFLQRDGLWTEPIHMGMVINTAGEEESPYLMPDKRTLIFSSNGHSGYGKKDLFVTTRLDDSWQNWSEPQNLGPVVNSPLDDMFLFVPLDGDLGYFCREVPGYDLDIHTFNLPLLTNNVPLVQLCGNIVDPQTEEAIDTEVVFTRLRDGVEVGRVRTDQKGDYCIELPAEELYSYSTELPGLVPVGATIDLLAPEELNDHAATLTRIDLNTMTVQSDMQMPKLTNVESVDVMDEEALLAAIAAAEPISIKDIFFDFDKDNLTEASWVELRNLFEVMQKYPESLVELSGHTDSYGSDEYNIDLSERRVESAKSGLLSLGIDPKRIKISWQGESKIFASNRTSQGRAMNRRVSIKVVKLDD